MAFATKTSSTWARWTFCAAVLGFALYQFSENTVDPDLWAHTMVGEHLWRTGKLQNYEPYSWTAPGTPWINHELLAEMAIGGAHWIFGGAGILWLKVLVGFLTFAIALRLGFRDLKWPERGVAWAVAGVAVVEISYGFAARPQIFTALGLVVELALLRKIADGDIRWCLALPVLTGLWVNTHGGVMAGLAIMFVTSGCWTAQWKGPAFLKKVFGEAVAGKAVVTLWITSVVSSAALLVNPYGWRLIEWTINGVVWLHQRTELEEWRPTPPNISHASMFVLLLVAGVSFLFTRRTRSLWEIAICAALGLFALRSVRHVPLFAVAALAFVPPHLADLLDRFREHYSGLAEAFRQRSAQVGAALVLAMVTVGEVAGTFLLHKDHPLTMEVPRNQYPMAAVGFMQSHQLKGNLLVFFDWGEMCLWELPNCAVSLDGRWETCYPRDLIPEHWKFYNDEPVNKNILDLDKADLALLPGNLVGAVSLAHKPGWSVVYQDNLAVILAHHAENFAGLAGMKLPVEGQPNAAIGRDAFPNGHAARFYR